MGILRRHIIERFVRTFLFCVLGVIVIFIVVDLVENVDRFIDAHVPWHAVGLYYLLNIPFIVVLTLPMATILSTTLLVGSMAKDNETVALKALGFSYYQIMTLLLLLGACISMLSFGLAEGVAARATRSRVEMERAYLKKHLDRDQTRYHDLNIQEPPYWHISMSEFDSRTSEARQVKIERLLDNRRIQMRIDADLMKYENGQWLVIPVKNPTYQRSFEGENETAAAITDTLRFGFTFTPKDLIQVKIVSEEKSIFELYKFAMRTRASGGKIHRWMTDIHLRIAFPISNILVVFLCIPLVYNRRKKSVAEGVGISLLICFVYFGLIKTGQTLGHKEELGPFIGAWLGNITAILAGLVNLVRVRK
ncbi:LptF/LptG family permease [bacterium]|nr:LptF/LptG family permease [bacterium]